MRFQGFKNEILNLIELYLRVSFPILVHLLFNDSSHLNFVFLHIYEFSSTTIDSCFLRIPQDFCVSKSKVYP